MRSSRARHAATRNEKEAQAQRQEAMKMGYIRKTYEKSVQVRLADRRAMCMNAVGSSAAFRNCLNGSLPITVDFQRYIAIATARNEPEDRNACEPNPGRSG